MYMKNKKSIVYLFLIFGLICLLILIVTFHINTTCYVKDMFSSIDEPKTCSGFACIDMKNDFKKISYVECNENNIELGVYLYSIEFNKTFKLQGYKIDTILLTSNGYIILYSNEGIQLISDTIIDINEFITFYYEL